MSLPDPMSDNPLITADYCNEILKQIEEDEDKKCLPEVDKVLQFVFLSAKKGYGSCKTILSSMRVGQILTRDPYNFTTYKTWSNDKVEFQITWNNSYPVNPTTYATYKP